MKHIRRRRIAIANLLFNVDLTGFNPEKFEKTREHTQQVILSMNKVQKFWYHLLNDNVHPETSECTHGRWRAGKKHPKWIVFEHYKSMDFGKYCKGTNYQQEFWTQTWKLFVKGQDFQHHKSPDNAITVRDLKKNKKI
eukprot:COSAG02_NODE_8509_length_2543_cov_2.043372_2_plen_138_part_00